MIDCTARFSRDPTLEEAHAFALVTGMENIVSGNTALVDQALLPLTKEHYYSVAQAYKDLGLRAWVFTEISDLPFAFYTSEYFPEFDQAVSFRDLPEELQEICEIEADHRDILDAVEAIIRGWSDSEVHIGVGLDNPVCCSDDLMRGAAQLASELDTPINFHAEESRIQREIHFAKWGESAIARSMRLGLLTPGTLVTHAVQVDAQDIHLLAVSGSSVSHNPISNLKLRNGIAPIGKMLSAGIKVCLGSDGSSSGDSQSLFSVMRFAAALSPMNGLEALGDVESTVFAMGTSNADWLWPGSDPFQDFIAFSPPVGPLGYIWDDPAPLIKEVYIRGIPRLSGARELVESRGADVIVSDCRLEMLGEERDRRARVLADWAQSRPADLDS